MESFTAGEPAASCKEGGARSAAGLFGMTAPENPSPSGPGVSGQCGAGSWCPDLPSEGGYGGTVPASSARAAAGEAAGSLQETPWRCPI